jgi:hypothetical protein
MVLSPNFFLRIKEFCNFSLHALLHVIDCKRTLMTETLHFI